MLVKCLCISLLITLYYPLRLLGYEKTRELQDLQQKQDELSLGRQAVEVMMKKKEGIVCNLRRTAIISIEHERVMCMVTQKTS